MNFHYVDIGAANNTREAEWNLHVPEATYSLFEPDPVAFERLQKIRGSNIGNVLKIALGSSPGLKEFNICRKRELSSFLQPNYEMVNRFPDKERWEIEMTEEIKIETLDSQLPIIGPIDFIKLDTQGTELDILNGAILALKNIIGIQVEVEFIELYKTQPLFDEVFKFLYGLNFELWDLTTIYRYGRDKLDRSGQSSFADALFFRPPEQIVNMYEGQERNEKLHKLSLISKVYGKKDMHDLCKNLLNRM